MAPAAATTPAPASRSVTPTKAPKTVSTAMKIDTSKIEASKGSASAALSTISSSIHSASTLSRSSSTFSELTVASSASTGSFDYTVTSGSCNFEEFNVETALHKVAVKFTVDILNGDLIADGVLVHGGKRIDGVRFELAKYLGNVDGVLEWHTDHKNVDLDKDYYKTCEDIKIVIEHDGCYIVAQCKKYNDTWVSSRFNLSEELYILRGRIEVHNKELTRVLSEVPWMKFKVVAEPDFAVFFQHEMMQKMMNKVTLNVVNHVTAEMNLQIALAVEAATKVVAESAMTFAMEQMQVMVQSASLYGKAQRSSTVAEHLHMF